MRKYGDALKIPSLECLNRQASVLVQSPSRWVPRMLLIY